MTPVGQAMPRFARVLSVAIGAHGHERARADVDQAGATFPTLIAQARILSRLLGFKVVPNGLLLDESGGARFAKFGGFTVEEGPTRAMVERWLQEGHLDEQCGVGEPAPLDSEAIGLFEAGLAAIQRGDREGAAHAWRAATEKDPTNWLIRKQLCALDHPERC